MYGNGLDDTVSQDKIHNAEEKGWIKGKIILASASPRRLELLGQIGISPEIIPSTVEEKVTETEPGEVVKKLSRQKAEEVAARIGAGQTGPYKKCAVIGADTVVSVDGRILGKPSDRSSAKEMLRLIQGRKHQVYTGVTVIAGEVENSFFEETLVDVYPMEEYEIDRYIDCGESMDKAGAYGIQGRFAAYIRGIEGSYTNVMGLPVGRLFQELKKTGFVSEG